jgi:quercetin dioxygenase-like cupin family protein
MICRRYNQGQRLDVAGINQIVVIIDRSETARTEVGLNIWPAGTVGPRHRHEEKEQTFFVTSGRGEVTVGDEKRQIARGDVVFVPAGAEHQTIAAADEDLHYLLYNAFLGEQKEGHATFAEHIEKVKATRREQAERARKEPRRGA